MILRVIAAGFAVALLASPAVCAEQRSGQFVVAQADSDATQYLSEARPLSSLSDKELKQRVRAGRQLIKGGSLSGDDRKKVRQAMQAAAQELKSRGSGDESDTAGDEGSAGGQNANNQAAQSTQNQNQAQKQKQKAEQQTAASTQGGASGSAAATFLADNRPPAGMDERALRQRLRAGRDLMKDTSISDADRKRVRQIVQALRQELQKRGKGGDQAEDTDQMQGQGATGVETRTKNAGTSDSASQFLADNRPLDQVSEKDLKQRMRAGRELMKGGSLSQADRKRVQDVVRAARLEIAKRGGKAGDDQSTDNTGPATTKKAGNEQGDAGAGGNVVADNSDAAKLDEQGLRRRVQAARDSLAGGQLSQQESRALRQKLAADRRELRRRVSGKLDRRGGDAESQASVDWLQDRREARALNDRELEARLAFYRTRINKGDLTPEQKAQFRIILDRDRQEFRTRAVVVRDERMRKLRTRVASKQLNIQININPPGAPPPEVWAAEADDQMIVSQLVRRPARKFDRRYSFEEVTAEPELRAAMPAVEVDTVTFGFNEDFVREEQMENLDRIGSILEEILAEHPQEVFMIEGHTDAVGSDDANLDLSRRRAAAIKDALTQYYAIGAENLRTVGFGERYLKIQTEEPEEENRRITIRRITPAVGELQG